MEICGLNSYTHDLINILFEKIEFLHIVKELTKVKYFIRKVWVCSHVVIYALRGVGSLYPIDVDAIPNKIYIFSCQ